VWSVPILVGLLIVQRQWSDVRRAVSNRRSLGLLLVTTSLIGFNWYVFIWAVANDQVLQASLGYFINPLVNVGLGVLLLRERLSRLATIAVALAAAGVGYQALLGGDFPWVALALAFSFGFYGLLRKTAAAGAVVGLAVETALLTPVAMVYLLMLNTSGDLSFASGDITLDMLLVLAGVVTSIPLVCFTQAARLLPLSTIGFLQYIAPTMHFSLAVAAYGEPFHARDLITFFCIWVALAIFTFDRVRRSPSV